MRGIEKKNEMPRVGVEPTLILAEILKNLLKVTQKTTQVDPNVLITMQDRFVL